MPKVGWVQTSGDVEKIAACIKAGHVVTVSWYGEETNPNEIDIDCE
jgi:hypothetical protein